MPAFSSMIGGLMRTVSEIRVIADEVSAAEEMASTTEELTGQSDQLVSALSFFRTGNDDRLATVRTAAKPVEHFHAEAARAQKLNGQAVAVGVRPAKAGGVSLHLKYKHEVLDSEFERY